MTFIEYKQLTESAELNNYFKLLNGKINNDFNLNSDDAFFLKLKELLDQKDYVHYFDLLSENGQYFIDHSLYFFLYSTMYVALEKNLFGIFHGFYKVFNNILKQGDVKDVVLQNFFKLFDGYIRTLSKDQLIEIFKNEINILFDSVNLIQLIYAMIYNGVVGFDVMEGLLKLVFEDVRLPMSEKGVALITTQKLIMEKKFVPEVTLTLNFGKDAEGKVVTWYKDFPLKDAKNFMEYHIVDMFQQVHNLTSFQRDSLLNFFIYEYILRMNDFFLKPLDNNPDSENTNLLLGVYSLCMKMFSEVMPNVFKPVATISVPEGYEDVLRGDFNAFIADKSLKVYEVDPSKSSAPEAK